MSDSEVSVASSTLSDAGRDGNNRKTGVRVKFGLSALDGTCKVGMEVPP